MKVTTIVKVVIWFFLYLIIFNTSLAMKWKLKFILNLQELLKRL